MAETVNGRWVVRAFDTRESSPYLQAHVRDKRSGKVHHFSTGVKVPSTDAAPRTREKAYSAARQAVLDFIAEQEQRERLDVQPANRRFDDTFDLWLSLKTCREVTLDAYRIDFEKVYKPHFRDSYLDEITRADLERLILVKYKKKARRTRQKHLVCLRSFFSWCVEHKYIADNPAAFKLPGRAPKRKKRVMTYDQASALLSACRDERVVEVDLKSERRRGDSWNQTVKPPEHIFLAVLVGLHTGLRFSNIRGLTWKDVDLEQGTFFISAERMKGNADFEAPIHPELLAVLRDCARSDGPVIGRDLRESKNALKTACRVASIEAVSWHTLRHTFKTWAARVCSHSCLKALMAHAADDITLEYGEVSLDEMREALEKLPGLTVPSTVRSTKA